MSKKIYDDCFFLFYLLQLLLLITIPYIISEKSNGENFLKGDCFYYKAIVVSIMEDGDLILDNNIPLEHHLSGQLSLGKDGNLVPKHSVFMSIISLPFYYFLGNQGLLLFNLFICFTVFFLMYFLNREFHRPLISFLTVFIYFPCTMFLYYTYNFSPDIFSTIFIIGSLCLLFRKKFYLSTVVIGLSLFAKVTNLVLAIPIMMYMFVSVFFDYKFDFDVLPLTWGKKIKIVLLIIFLFFVSLFPFFYTNMILFGSPIENSYENIVISKDDQNNIMIDKCSNKFNQPFIEGIKNLLFNIKNGLLTTNPILIASFLGFIFLVLKKNVRQKHFFLIILILLQIFFFCKYDYLQASQFSNRFLMPVIAFSSIFTGYFIDNILKSNREYFSLKNN